MRAVYGDRSDFIALVANAGAGLLLPARAHQGDAGAQRRPRAIPDVRLRDHSPFWDQAYDAVMATDTSFMQNPHYYQRTDTVETLDLPLFCGVVEGAAGALGRL